MRSRPKYAVVEKHPASALHLFISEYAMSDAMSAIYNSCLPSERQSLILAQADTVAEQLSAQLPSLPLATTFYLAGSESYLWSVAGKLQEQGVLEQQIRMFAPTSTARNVFCCHCYTITENVTETPVICAGCQRPQGVTDHFSRLHGAYRGCQVNAEDPDEIPESMELS